MAAGRRSGGEEGGMGKMVRRRGGRLGVGLAVPFD